MFKFSLMGPVGSVVALLAILSLAGCDQGQRPLDAYGSSSPPPMPKIAVGEFMEYPAPGFPVNGRQLLVDALNTRLQEQGMLWSGDGNPRIDLTGSLQAYEGRYASPADDSVVIDLSGELRDGSRTLVKSQVNRRIRPGSDWSIEISQMAEQLLDDLRAKISVPPSTTGVSAAPGYSGYPAYGAGSYSPPTYYYDPYSPYYMDRPYYYGYYGPSYLNMYWLSYYWTGRHHHHHRDDGGHQGGPRPRPQPIPPGVSQSIPRTHPDDRHPPSLPGNRRPAGESIRDALPRSHDRDRPPPQEFIQSTPEAEPQSPGFRPNPAIMAVPRSSRPRDGGVQVAPRDIGGRGRMPASPPPAAIEIPRTHRPSYSSPPVVRPDSRPSSIDIPRRPTFSSPPPRFAPPSSVPSFRPPQTRSAPAAPAAPRAAPSMRGGGGGFGGMAPGSQRRRR